ncbi:MAG TPA: hypothetical protein VLH56_18190 [Dissulfurispiraceae bacterium]|nr:hypothetical protein [Dissulfurispiraceae bacterium]
MELSQIRKKIVRGDLLIAGKMIGITRQNAKMALVRKGSKYHERVKAALIKIYASREALISESRNQ